MKQQDNQNHSPRKHSWLKLAVISIMIGFVGSLSLFWVAGSIIYTPQIDGISICDGIVKLQGHLTRHSVQVSTYTFKKISSESFLDATFFACGDPLLDIGYVTEELQKYNPTTYYLASPLMIINTAILSALSFGFIRLSLKHIK